MASLFNQTNINTNRYFFATQLDGEQQLFTSNTGVAPAQNTYIGITGGQGNEVLISQMPTFEGTDWVSGGGAVFAGTNSDYLTLSTIATNSAGASISIDRLSGSGVTCIENYGTNGSLKGFEFLSRGVNSELISTNSVGINNYVSSIGRPGATAVLGASGTLLTQAVQASGHTSLDQASGTAPFAGGRSCFGIQDLSGAGGVTAQPRWSIGTVGLPSGGNVGSDLNIFSYNDAGNFLASPMTIQRSTGATNLTFLSSVNGVPYAQNLLSTLCSGTQSNTVGSNTVTVLFSTTSATTSNMIAGQNYLVDFPSLITAAAPGGSGAFLELGLRLGGNGAFNYLQTMYIPSGGLPAQGVASGIVQVCDMGTANKNIDLVGYLQGVASLGISASQPGGGAVAYMKNLT